MRSDERLGCFFKDFQSLEKFCHDHPESKYDREGEYFGFRVDTEFYSYLVRLNPRQNDYNFYVYCYRRDWLNYNITQAARGIRFIDSKYDELFRLKDGDQIRVDRQDGSSSIYTCRYINESHVQVGDTLYHVSEFAELMERNGSTVTPLRSSLPDQCYGFLAATNEITILKKIDYPHSIGLLLPDRHSLQQQGRGPGPCCRVQPKAGRHKGSGSGNDCRNLVWLDVPRR